MKKVYLSLVFCLFIFALHAQVAINEDNANPDASAMLDVKSTNKGMLIPRMSSAQREMIASPATGLMVFDIETGSFWFFDGNHWMELVAGAANELADADGDTKIQVEESVDEDVIRFDIQDKQLMELIPGGELDLGGKNIVDDKFFSGGVISTADLDQDGNMDILGAATTFGRIYLYINDGNKNFSRRDMGFLFAPLDVEAADVDSDGDLDIMGVSSNRDDGVTDIFWWENDGNLNFTEHKLPDDIERVRSIEVFDMDGDGDTDFVTGSHEEGIMWWENDGNQNFSMRAISNTNIWMIDAADMDSDGDMDIVGGRYLDNYIYWWENDGNQNFTQREIDNAFADPRGVFAADIDSDGDMDVLGAAYDDNEVAWWENDGNQNFSIHTITNNLGLAKEVYASDIDGDNDIDVLAIGRNASGISFWENDGSQNFTEVIVDEDYTSANDIVAEDIDNDGKIDILATSASTNEITYWRNEVEGTLHIDTKVGIGTEVPSTELEVNGTLTASAFAGDGAGLTNLNVTDYSGDISDLQNDVTFNGGLIDDLDTRITENQSDIADVKMDLSDEVADLDADIFDLEGDISENQSDISNNQSDISALQTDLQQAAPIGTIQMWPTSSPPTGWLICNGTSFSSTTYPDLANVLGSTNLPNFSGRFPLGVGNSGTSGSTNHNIGSNGGEEKHTLSINEIPNHSHGAGSLSTSQAYLSQVGSGDQDKRDGGGTKLYEYTSITGNTASVGGGQAHNNMPPFYTINFIIKAE